MQLRNCFVLLICTLIASCANTSITQSWVEKDLTHSYKRPLIIGISDSQQTRRIFENHVVAELAKKQVNATPSYTLINSKQKMDRETVVNTLKGTDLDSVLVTYLVSADSEMKHRDSPLNTSYSGNVSDNEVSATIITNRGRYTTQENISLKSDFYDASTKTMVWTAQSKSVAIESIDKVVTDVTRLIVDQLFSDNIFQ